MRHMEVVLLEMVSKQLLLSHNTEGKVKILLNML